MRLILRILCMAFFGCFSVSSSIGQTCPTGYTATSLNWENLDFLIQDPTYISASKAQNQYFAFGTNKLKVTHNFVTAKTGGETAEHTAEGSSYATGTDISFTGDGFITISFQSEVRNVRFSLYDIDYNQKVTVTAVNGTLPQNVGIAKATGTLLNIAGNNTTSASATATANAVDNSTDATVNVDITAPVTSITINISATGTKNGNPKEDGIFYLSNINGCINTPSFPLNYYAISKPLTNQPGYVLSAIDNRVLMVNPANGKSKLLFADPSGNNINSLAYDPYNKFVYYTYSLTSGGKVNTNNKSIQKYDVSTGVISTVVSNVNTLGIPTYTSGVESGAAAFYGGSLYIGIEGIDGDESKIWRIDFDASFNPLLDACLVFGIPTAEHDWSDFAINNGTLIDFDGKSSSSSTRYENIYHINLQTGATLASYNYAALGFVPRQVAVDWNGKIYNTGTAATSSTGTIELYNNGVVDPANKYTIIEADTLPSGSWGDAAEAFRPKVDFGDAPASYDLNSPTLTFHESNSLLSLGSTVKTEWNQLSTSNTDDDDDGLYFVPILNQGGGVYQTTVKVLNNTGSAVTVGGWMDFNGDGIFQEDEGVITTLNTSSTQQQDVSLYWTGIKQNMPNNSSTFLRIRVTSATNNMTKANATGYFSDGEVEDWHVLVNATTLAVNLKQFSAENWGAAKSRVYWLVDNESSNCIYELQRSSNGLNWNTIHTQKASANADKTEYTFVDNAPFLPGTFYRLKYYELGEPEKYSIVQQVLFQNDKSIKVFPNPAVDQVTVTIDAIKEELCQLYITDAGGKNILTKMVNLQKGSNRLELPIQQWTPGVYYIQVQTSHSRYSQNILVQKN